MLKKPREIAFQKIRAVFSESSSRVTHLLKPRILALFVTRGFRPALFGDKKYFWQLQPPGMFEGDRGEFSPPLSFDNDDPVVRHEPDLVWVSIPMRGRGSLKKPDAAQIAQRFSACCQELVECRGRLGTFGHGLMTATVRVERRAATDTNQPRAAARRVRSRTRG